MKKYSNEHEENVTDLLKLVDETAYKVSNSGAPDFKCGDVVTNKGLFECKTKKTKSKSISIKEEWLEKIQEEAFIKNKEVVGTVINFGEGGKNYFILNEEDFLMLYDNYLRNGGD